MTNNTLQEASDKEAGTLKKSTAREYTEAILIALLLALLIRTFIIQAFKIPSEETSSFSNFPRMKGGILLNA